MQHSNFIIRNISVLAVCSEVNSYEYAFNILACETQISLFHK